MTDHGGTYVGAWWRGQGRWKWWVLGALTVLAVAAATESHKAGASKVTSVVPAMTSQNWDFWNRLTSSQQTQLALDCRSQAAGDVSGSSATDSAGDTLHQIALTEPTKIAREVSNIYPEYSESPIHVVCAHAIPKVIANSKQELQDEKTARDEHQGEQREEQKENQRKTLIGTVANGTFKATSNHVREYIADDQIAESLRSVSCVDEAACDVSFNGPALTGPGVVEKLLNIESTPLSEAFDPMRDIFKAVFADKHLQQATVTSWVELETKGGKLRRWPALRVACNRSAANQIDWERVTPGAVKELCTLTELPDGSPPS